MDRFTMRSWLPPPVIVSFIVTALPALAFPVPALPV